MRPLCHLIASLAIFALPTASQAEVVRFGDWTVAVGDDLDRVRAVVTNDRNSPARNTRNQMR